MIRNDMKLHHDYLSGEYRKALSMAISALQAQDLQPTCNQLATDTISRQEALDAVNSETVSTNPEHFKSSEKFIKFMDDADIASFGKWQWANGFNTAVVATRIQLEKLPSAQKKVYTKADYIMALHKEYGCSLARAGEAHQKALEYLRNTSMMKG